MRGEEPLEGVFCIRVCCLEQGRGRREAKASKRYIHIASREWGQRVDRRKKKKKRRKEARKWGRQREVAGERNVRLDWGIG